MEKTFDPAAVEARWRELWEQRGYFAPSGRGEPYCIIIPPPNVTGTLHMGHAFQHTLMDALIRCARMRGDDALWLPGTDHAGIATQLVVERQLAAAGENRLALGREAFVERVWRWKQESGGTITRQMRRLGASVDWSRERFTMDEAYSQAVIEHFVRLYDEGLIYRGQRLVNWDPVLGTAISDLEVEYREERGHLWHLRYPLADGARTRDGKAYLTVATTRPETLLGDVAVAVHPEDERYRDLVGRRVRLPLAEREIPIIADDYVDRAFGSGCVKITPAHDFNDYAVGQRHRLPLINVFTAQARLNEAVPSPYRGLDRLAARQRIVEDLRAQDLLDKVEEHVNKVPYGDRSGVVIEPFLTDQWFVDLTREQLPDGRPGGRARITEPAIRAVAEGRIRFVPETWANTYFAWLRNIQDWCISRQLWWGHRIPAWYDPQGRVYVGRDEAEARRRAGLDAGVPLRRDDDVFDTWFSSDIWPLAALGWPRDTAELRRYYPTRVLVTGFDIIFFWVARMVMMGQFFAGREPFSEVYITGLIRDAEGRKMSKSKGNILDPLDLIDGISLEALVAKRTSGLLQPQLAKSIERATRRDYPEGIAPLGVDALRFTFCALAAPGRDIRFDAGRAAGYRNFCNKLWNAARFALLNTGDDEPGPEAPSTADRWIVSRLQRVEAEVAEHLRAYRFDLLAQALYQFVWNEYCDWYLELSKPALQQGNPEQRRAARRTLLRVLEATLRLLHPIMPFITEELWQKVAPRVGRDGETVMRQPYPQAEAAKIDPGAEADIEWLRAFILGVRQIRGEMDIAPGRTLPLLLRNAGPTDLERIRRLAEPIAFLARVEPPRLLAADEPEPPAATALLGDMKILVPMAGLIDKTAELARLDKLIDRLQAELERNDARLSDPRFLGGAPTAVVEQQRARVERQRRELTTLKTQRQRVAVL